MKQARAILEVLKDQYRFEEDNWISPEIRSVYLYHKDVISIVEPRIRGGRTENYIGVLYYYTNRKNYILAFSQEASTESRYILMNRHLKIHNLKYKDIIFSDEMSQEEINELNELFM